MGVLAVNTLKSDVVGVQAGSPTVRGEYRERVCAARSGGDKSDGEKTKRVSEGASEKAGARVASEKASGPTPLGLAPERQSGLRALIITQRLVGEGAARFPPLLTDSRYQFASLSLSLSRQLATAVDSWGRSSPPLRSAVDGCRGREEEHGLSLRVAALQHSRLPRPFRGAGTPRSIYTYVRTHTGPRTTHIHAAARTHRPESGRRL